jgi:ribonuclease P protein component
MQKNELKQLRCAWSISKQVGPATTRNRFKRWAREYCRKWLANDPQSLDMNLIFKRRDKAFYQAVSHEDFDGAMDILVQKMRRYIK